MAYPVHGTSYLAGKGVTSLLVLFRERGTLVVVLYEGRYRCLGLIQDRGVPQSGPRTVDAGSNYHKVPM